MSLPTSRDKVVTLLQFNLSNFWKFGRTSGFFLKTGTLCVSFQNKTKSDISFEPIQKAVKIVRTAIHTEVLNIFELCLFLPHALAPIFTARWSHNYSSNLVRYFCRFNPPRDIEKSGLFAQVFNFQLFTFSEFKTWSKYLGIAIRNIYIYI